MKRMVKFAAAGLILSGLAGCTGMQLDRAQGVEPQGTAFDVNLYAEYLTLSTSEYDEYDYKDSDTFASRAMAAAAGNPSHPEEIAARDLPPETVGELTGARLRLVSALDGGAATSDPMHAARAQAMFDCWMQEQEENIQPDDIAACRANFEEAMKSLEMKPMAEAKPMAKPEPMMMPESEEFMVFFDFDSAQLSPEAHRMINDAARSARKAPPKAVVLTGHTDRAGASQYNSMLSTRRVEAVKTALEAAGLPGNVTVTAVGAGESSPRVSTEDGVRSAANRRVVIFLNRS